MKPDKKFFDFIEREEGKRNNVYPDSRGLPTIGKGHLLTKDELSSGKITINGERVKYRNGLTDSQIENLLLQDCSFAMKTIDENVKVPLTQNQYNALLSLVFNIGETSFEKSTLLKLLNIGNYKMAVDEFLKWKFSGGKPILLERRKREIILWNSEN